MNSPIPRTVDQIFFTVCYCDFIKTLRPSEKDELKKSVRLLEDYQKTNFSKMGDSKDLIFGVPLVSSLLSFSFTCSFVAGNVTRLHKNVESIDLCEKTIRSSVFYYV